MVAYIFITHKENDAMPFAIKRVKRLIDIRIGFAGRKRIK